MLWEQWRHPRGIACWGSVMSCSMRLSTLGKWACRISDRAAVACDPLVFCFCDKGLRPSHQLRLFSRHHCMSTCASLSGCWERGPFVGHYVNGSLKWIIKDQWALCSRGVVRGIFDIWKNCKPTASNACWVKMKRIQGCGLKHFLIHYSWH